jgi:hypothetical protein
MTNFKGYLGYRIKKSLFPTLTFSLIALAISAFSARACAYRFMGHRGSMGIETLATIVGIIASIIPMLELSEFKSRRNLDTLYCLPISRRKMAAAHYLSGFIQMFTVYTAAFLAHTAVLLRFADDFRLEYMPLYYVLLLLLGTVVYSVFMFLFGEANSNVDGVVCCILWSLALWVAMSALAYPIREFASKYIFNGYDNIHYFTFTRHLSNFAAWLLPHAPINNLTVVFQSVMQGWENFNDIELYYPTFEEAIERNFPHWYMVFPWIAAGAASVWGYFRTFERKGAERAEDISSSPFCYKALIPLYGASLVMLTVESDIMMFFLTVAAMYIGYAIYRRSFRIKKADVITVASAAIGSLAFLMLVNIIFN